jgi:hypothetical protein
MREGSKNRIELLPLLPLSPLLPVFLYFSSYHMRRKNKARAKGVLIFLLISYEEKEQG